MTGHVRADAAHMPFAANAFDAIVTDPPYGLEFMGKEWDRLWTTRDKAAVGNIRGRQSTSPFLAAAVERYVGGETVKMWHQQWAAEALRVLRPGAHLVAFGGTRTHHRLMCALEDAGFEIRDCLMWLYGSGFPKSLDVSKAIDKAAGAEREVVAVNEAAARRANKIRRGVSWADESVTDGSFSHPEQIGHITGPATDAARQWSGWGTALKPAWEIVICAMKPHDLRGLCAILAQRIHAATCQLASSAKRAEGDSPSSPSECAAASDSALWSAVAACSTPAALYEVMGTWPCASAMPSSLSIALSWLDTLAAISAHASTFTTKTAASLTTDLRTLNSSRLQITPAIITEAAISPPGTVSNASLVAGIFSGVRARLSLTLEPSVLGPVTSSAAAQGLRPNYEPIILARKPLSEPNVAANVLRYGTGGIHVDGCRIGPPTDTRRSKGSDPTKSSAFPHSDDSWTPRLAVAGQTGLGRWPANVVLDEDAAAMLDEQSGERRAAGPYPTSFSNRLGYGGNVGKVQGPLYADTGGASRFFYTAKADTSERTPDQDLVTRNHHPTVKPLALMEWLIRLVTPPGGLILDPFGGSGTTALAAKRLGVRCVLGEREADYLALAQRRVAALLL